MGNGWGQINDGAPYHVLTVDLDRAIAHLGLSRYETMLLQYVREHSWGTQARTKSRNEPWPDPVPVEINVSDLAREWGVPRQRLNEARWSLTNRNVLIDEDGRLSINKLASTWIGLTPQSHAYAQKQSLIQRTPQRSTDKGTPTENRTPQRSGGERPSVQGVNAPAFYSTNTERARVPEDSEDSEECMRAAHALSIEAPESGAQPTTPPATPVDPRLVALGKKIDRLGAEPSVVYRLAELEWPVEWIEVAVYRAIGTGKSVTDALSVGYLQGILKRFPPTGPGEDDRAKVVDQKRAARPVEYYEGTRRKAAQ
jgi:hypothetical protein